MRDLATGKPAAIPGRSTRTRVALPARRAACARSEPAQVAGHHGASSVAGARARAQSRSRSACRSRCSAAWASSSAPSRLRRRAAAIAARLRHASVSAFWRSKLLDRDGFHRRLGLGPGIAAPRWRPGRRAARMPERLDHLGQRQPGTGGNARRRGEAGRALARRGALLGQREALLEPLSIGRCHAVSGRSLRHYRLCERSEATCGSATPAKIALPWVTSPRS